MPTVKELRAELARLGLDTRGLKAALEARLAEQQQQQETEQGEAQAEEEQREEPERPHARRRSGVRSPSSSPPPGARSWAEPEEPELYSSDLDDGPVDSSREGRILFATTLVGESSRTAAWWRRPLQVLVVLGASLLLLSMACNSRQAYCSRPSLRPGDQASAACSHLGMAEQGCDTVHTVRQLCAGTLHSAGALLGSTVGVDTSTATQPGREFTGQELSRAELRTEILELRRQFDSDISDLGRQFDSDLHAVKHATLEDCTLAAAHERTEDAASRVALEKRVQAAELELQRLQELLQESAEADDATAAEVAARLDAKADAASIDALAAAIADKSDTATMTALLAESSQAAASALDALSATVADKADMTAVTTLLANKADTADLEGVSSASGENAERYSDRLASLAAEVSENKAKLANSVSREEHSSLSAAVSETADGLSEAERSIDDVRETLSAAQDALRKEHGDALAALEAAHVAQKTLPNDLLEVAEAQTALQRRVTELQAAQDQLQEGANVLSGIVADVKEPVGHMDSRLNAIETKMEEATTETRISELGAQLTQLRDELAECRTTLSAAIDTVQGQSSAARDKLSDRIDEIKAKLLMLEQGVEGARKAAAVAMAEREDRQVAAATTEAPTSEAAAAQVAALDQQILRAQQQLTSLADEVSAITSQLAAAVSREEYSSLSAVVSETKDGLSEAVRSIDGVRQALVVSQDALKKEHGDELLQHQLAQRAQAERLDQLAAAVADESGTTSSAGAGIQPHYGVVTQHIHNHLYGDRINYAQLVLGAKIWRGPRGASEQQWTTPTFVQPSSSIEDAYLSLFDSSEQNAAEHTIDGSGGRLLGNCWAMEHISDPNDEMQSSGTITIGLAHPVIVDEIFIEHSYAPVSPNMSSAPRLVQAWGHVERRDTQGIFLGDFVYVKEHNEKVQPRQTFAVGGGDGGKGVAVSAVRLEVMANHGSQDYTCVYGIGVHGTAQSE